MLSWNKSMLGFSLLAFFLTAGILVGNHFIGELAKRPFQIIVGALLSGGLLIGIGIVVRFLEKKR